MSEPVTGPPVSGPYGKERFVVVGASGSTDSITSFQTFWPLTEPSPCWRRASRSALVASPPPPAPKIDPMKAVTAITSLTVAGGRSMPLARQ